MAKPSIAESIMDLPLSDSNNLSIISFVNDTRPIRLAKYRNITTTNYNQTWRLYTLLNQMKIDLKRSRPSNSLIINKLYNTKNYGDGWGALVRKGTGEGLCPIVICLSIVFPSL